MARTSKPKNAGPSAKADSTSDPVSAKDESAEPATSAESTSVPGAGRRAKDRPAAPPPTPEAVGETPPETPRPSEPEQPDAVADIAVNEAQPEPPAPAPVAPPPRSGGGGALILGGVVAAALGAGAMFFSVQQGWLAAPGDTEALTAQAEILTAQGARLDAQAAEIAAFSTEVAALPGAIDALRRDLADTGATDALAAQIGDLAARIDAIEVQPIPEAQLPQQVVDAYEARLVEMQAALDARMAGIQAQLDARLADIAAQSDNAAELERAAQAAANASAVRAALAELDAALDAGTPFADAIAEVTQHTGATAPEALAAHADDGVPTLADLQQQFPAAARAALDAATRAAAASGEVDRLTAFMRTQLGARSLEPREGDDADAVLSRAEAAVNAADLDAALAELSALPADGQAEMSAWMTRAETRRAALAAAAGFSVAASSN